MVSALVLIGGFALYTHGDSPVFEAIRGPLASGEEEGYAPLDGPLSDKIEAGKVLPEVVFMLGTKKLLDLPNEIATKKIAMREMLAPKPAVQSTTSGPIQTAVTPSKIMSIGTGFDGISLNNGGGGWPPDTNGDIGPLNYVQTVNTSVKMIDRGTNPRPSKQFTFDAFMKAAGQPSSSPCGSQNYGDPVVLYDTTASRWVVLDFAFNSRYVPSYFCIAVSDNSDAFGTWKSAQLLASSTELADYPKMASTPGGIVISANMFKNGRSYSGAKVWVLDRNSLFAPKPSLKSILYNLGTSYFSLMPVNVKFPATSGLSANRSGYLLSDYGLNGSMRIFQFTVPNFATGATNTIKPATFPVAAYSSFSSKVPQFGSTETLDALGDRLMNLAEFDDATRSIYVSRTVTGSNSLAGIRWYQIPVTSSSPTNATSVIGTVISSTFSPNDATHRWMPSLAVNNKGELAIAYSSSAPATTFPGIFAVGRSAESLNSGTLDVAEVPLKVGTGSQSGGYNRWGDYSRVSVDPVNRCTFWFTTEYYSATGNNWKTWITPFTLTTCP